MTKFTTNEKVKKKNLIAIVPTEYGLTHYLAIPKVLGKNIKKNKKKC